MYLNVKNPVHIAKIVVTVVFDDSFANYCFNLENTKVLK